MAPNPQDDVLSLAAKAAIRKYLLLIFAPSGILVAAVSFVFGLLVKDSAVESAKNRALNEVVKDVSDVRVALHDVSTTAAETKKKVSRASKENDDALTLVRQTAESAKQLAEDVAKSRKGFRRLSEEFGDSKEQHQLLEILRATKEISQMIDVGVDNSVNRRFRVIESGIARVKVDSFGRGMGTVQAAHLSDATQILATPVGHHTFEVLSDDEKPVYCVTVRGLSYPSTDASTPMQFVIHVHRVSGAQVDEEVSIQWAVTEKPAPPSS